MAETRKITIEILSTSEKGDNDNTNQDSNIEDIKNSKNKGTAKQIFFNQVYSNAKTAISNDISLSLNRYFSMQEDYLGENVLNAVKTTVGKATSIGATILAAGKVGGVAGVAVAGIGLGINELISYQQRMSNYYQALNASNFQINFSGARAGLVNGGRGTEN